MNALHELLRTLELPIQARTALARARARWLFRGAAELGAKTMANGRVEVDARGRLVIRDCVAFISGIVPCQLTVHSGAELRVGDGCVFNYGVVIEAKRSVHLGARCMFGSHVRICDFDAGGARPVKLGDDVWVAHGAVIGPGVEIGDRAVVSAGSVVTRDVPPGTMAIGNPARIASQALTL